MHQVDSIIDTEPVTQGARALATWLDGSAERYGNPLCDAAEQGLSTLFPANIEWQCLRGLGDKESTRTASARRTQHEFVMGRRAAYAALRNVGFLDRRIEELNSHAGLTESDWLRVVGKNADRSPSWPKGYVGSISHSRNWIVAAAARHDWWKSIGIDSEPITTCQRAAFLKDQIGHSVEWQLLDSARLSLPAAFTLLFSAKEAFYKCWYPLRQRFVDFLDVMATSVEPEQMFAADGTHGGTITLKTVEAGEMQLRVRYQITGEDVFTLAALSHKDVR